MFKLITFYNNIKHEVEVETEDEVLSLAVNAFDQNHELHEIRKNEECYLLHSEIYDKIHRAIY